MLNVIVVQTPSSMHYVAILLDLFGRECCGSLCGAMGRDGHDVGRAVGEPDASAAEGDLHHVAREVAGRMQHVLVRGCDAATGRVIVGPEMCGDAAPARRFEQKRESRLAVLVDD